MKKWIFFIILLQLLCSFCACNSYPIPESVKYDFTIRGPITGDVFQAIVTAKPGSNAITQHEQRESAFISAKDQVAEECINQMLEYYYTGKQKNGSAIPSEKIIFLKDKFRDFASKAVIEQEYYLQDNSVVFVVRIYYKGIKDKILNY